MFIWRVFYPPRNHHILPSSMNAAHHRVPSALSHCSPVPCAPPCSAGMSAEGVPSVSKHLQLALALHCASAPSRHVSCVPMLLGCRSQASRRRLVWCAASRRAVVALSWRGARASVPEARPRRAPGHAGTRQAAADDDDRRRPPPLDDHRRPSVAPPTDRTPLPPTTIARRCRRRRSPTSLADGAAVARRAAAVVIAVTEHPS